MLSQQHVTNFSASEKEIDSSQYSSSYRNYPEIAIDRIQIELAVCDDQLELSRPYKNEDYRFRNHHAMFLLFTVNLCL